VAEAAARATTRAAAATAASDRSSLLFFYSETSGGRLVKPSGCRPLPGCGYGASCRVAPERCPMRGRCTWVLLRPPS
jgi:hypothetical protein